ncbi:MAG TPA: hypothetical protein VD789_10850 [Thermomicrobiales bacterium]|nr:hypothetical protein [Thermomicrobiales bacterium]
MMFSTPRPIAKLTASIALAGALGLSGGAAVLAQDATPAGTPIGPGQCVAPEATPSASPVADGMALASPVAGETQAGTVVEDEAVIAEATAAVENLYACFNEGNGEAFVALYTAAGRVDALGSGDPAAIAAEISTKSTMVQAEGLEVHEVRSNDDGSLVVDYQVRLGHQLLHFSDRLVDQGGTWLVDARTFEMPESELDSTTASVKTSIVDGGVFIEVSPSPIMNQPAVKLQITNNGDTAQNVVLLQGGDAASITEVDFASLPEGVTFIGEGRAQAGEIVDIAFEELPEGNYVIVVEADGGETGSFDLTIDPPFDPTA